MFYTYVLESEGSGKRYIGQTKDLEKRIYKHNTKSTQSTKYRGPWKIIYYEQFESRTKAIQQEQFFKTGKGREYLENKLLRGVAQPG